MKPSDFSFTPWGSVLRNSECETVARNIMVIMSRTGDTFRPLEQDEYKSERLKDGNFSEGELVFFDRVIPYCVSADTARLFSPEWANVGE